MATITDVAKESNVSTSTVSMVANGNTRVSEVTRSRVESVMNRLNWRGRTATKSKKHHIGIVYGRNMIVSGELVDYCAKWIKGIRESFSEINVDVNVSMASEHVSEDLMFLHNLEHKELDGFVLMGIKPADGYVDCVFKEKLPIVFMGQKADKTQFSSVTANTWQAGRVAVDHFLELGHSKIAHLIVKRNHDRSVGGLYSAFLEALDERGVQLATDTRHHSPLDSEDVNTFIPIAKQLIEANVTACFTGDPIALRLIEALETLGVNVPDDFSVLGWDNLGVTTNNGNLLSSIGYDKPKMGMMAGQMLQKLMQEGRYVSNYTATVPVELNSGTTTAAAPCRVRSAYHPHHHQEEEYHEQETAIYNNQKQLEPELIEV